MICRSGTPEIQDRMGEYAAKIVDLKNEKYSQLIKMYNTKKRIEDKIDMLEQPYRNILYYKYINEEVAYKIKYDYDYTRKMHGIALIKYKKESENYDKIK